MLATTKMPKDPSAEHQDRVALLGETAAALAHEVKNPLGAIKLFLSLLKEDISGQVAPLELVGHIERSVETLDHVVSNILSFSRNRELSFTPVNLQSIIREQVAIFAPQLKGPKVSTVLKGSPFIAGSDHALRQLMSNLILNAAQATDFRGAISVRCEDYGDDAVKLTIHDDGAGIDESVLDRMFEPFVTTKSAGTGLGLSIVSQIVAGHGGTIVARNREGAEFEIVLPRSQRQ